MEVVCTEDEETQQPGQERMEEQAGEECCTVGTYPVSDASLSHQQESVCTDKEEENLNCQSPSGLTETSDLQQLSDKKASPVVDPSIPAQPLDCPHYFSPGQGTTEGDKDITIEVPGHGEEAYRSDLVGLDQKQDEKQDDLETVRSDERSEQKQENLENPVNMSNSENIESQKIQVLEQCDREGAVPIVLVTNLDEVSAERQAEDRADSEKREGTVPADVSPSASPSDVTDFSSSDLQFLKSDSVSLCSETTVSGKSDEQEGPEEDTRSVTASSVMEGPEEDTRSVTASSVMSLFQRMQMDPLEREWLRCAALGNAPGLRQLLLQDPSLAPKKDFVTGFTALHWAAKQGRIETVDMMARSGADVNQRAHGGYTPLHLASLHGHTHIIQLLINNYNAKVNIRDYHGKMASHYWNGSMDVFNMGGSQSGGKWSRGRRGQRYGQLSALLSRSRSQGNLNVELGPGSLELTPRLLPRSETNIQTLMDTF